MNHCSVDFYGQKIKSTCHNLKVAVNFIKYSILQQKQKLHQQQFHSMIRQISENMRNISRRGISERCHKNMTILKKMCKTDQSPASITFTIAKWNLQIHHNHRPIIIIRQRHQNRVRWLKTSDTKKDLLISTHLLL